MSERALHSKAVHFRDKGLELMKSVVVGVSTRVAGWGALGFFLGLTAWLVERYAGLLEIDASWWGVGVWLLLVLYMGAGALIFARAGLARGVGVVLRHVGVELGYVAFLIERILDGIVEKLRAAGVVEDVDGLMTRPLPLERVEEALFEAVDDIIDGGDGVVEEDPSFRSRLLTRMRAMLCDLIEQGTLSGLRGEEAVTLERVRQEALRRLEARYEAAVQELMDGARNRAFLFAAVLFSVVPIIAVFV